MNIKDNKNCKITINDTQISTKSADEMFNELGYIKEERNKAVVYIKHNKYLDKQIGFNDETKQIMIDTHYIELQEFNAIGKKMQELGWI